MNQLIKQNKNIIYLTVFTAVILSIPLIVMQFTSEVDWKLADFIIIGSLIMSIGLAYEFISRKFENNIHKVVLFIVLLGLLLLTWAELAVGIFGTPFAGS